MTLLPERLTQYRDDMGLENQRLAKIVGVTPSNIRAYLIGPGNQNGSAPTAQRLETMIDLLGVSADWLLGKKTPTKWGAEVQNLRLQLRSMAAQLTNPADDVVLRMIRVIWAMRKLSPLCQQDWFVGGILSIPEERVVPFLNEDWEIPENKLNLTFDRFVEFTGLPDRWLTEGNLDSMITSLDLGDFADVVLWFVNQGIEAKDLTQHRERIKNIILQFRRLG